MKIMFVAVAAALLPLSALACSGDIRGFWEKRPDGSKSEFEVVQEFRIDSGTGVLSVCGSDQIWNSQYSMSDGKMVFGYQRRERTLTKISSGVFVTPSWTADYKGVQSEYRVRAEN